MINNAIAATDEKLLRENGYVVGKVLGEGSFSKVKSAMWRKPGTSERLPVAIKIINKTVAPPKFLEKFWPRESEVMSAIEHENIIKMYEIFSKGNKIYMSLERAAHGDLLEHVQLKGPLDEFETHKYFGEMCSAIHYLHSKSIVHRDLKCENVLLTETNKIKVADFGFARRMDSSDVSKTFCGSPAYASPEILRGIPYEAFVPDVWSLGVILFIIACGLMPFRDNSISALLKDQQLPSLQFPKPYLLNSKYRDLVTNILCYDLSKRYNLDNIRSHEWLQTTPKSILSNRKQSTADSGLGSDGSNTTVNSSA